MNAGRRASGAAVLHYTTHRLKITSPVCVSTVRAVCNGRGRPRPGTALPHSRIRHPLYASLNFCSGALNRRRGGTGRARERASERAPAYPRRDMGHSPSKRGGKWFANRVARRSVGFAFRYRWDGCYLTRKEDRAILLIIAGAIFVERRSGICYGET